MKNNPQANSLDMTWKANRVCKAKNSWRKQMKTEMIFVKRKKKVPLKHFVCFFKLKALLVFANYGRERCWNTVLSKVMIKIFSFSFL